MNIIWCSLHLPTFEDTPENTNKDLHQCLFAFVISSTYPIQANKFIHLVFANKCIYTGLRTNAFIRRLRAKTFIWCLFAIRVHHFTQILNLDTYTNDIFMVMTPYKNNVSHISIQFLLVRGVHIEQQHWYIVSILIYRISHWY